MRTRARVNSTTSAPSLLWGTCDSAVTTRAGRLFQREGQDDGVETDHAMLFPGDVEVVPFHFLGIFLERHHRANRRHVPEGVGTLVETVATAHHLAVTDRRSLRAVHPHVGGRLGHEPNEKVDAVHLELYIGHRTL